MNGDTASDDLKSYFKGKKIVNRKSVTLPIYLLQCYFEIITLLSKILAKKGVLSRHLYNFQESCQEVRDPEKTQT